MSESPAVRAICSSCSDRRLPMPVARRRCADVEECQLRDPGPKVWHDDTDANQPSAGERTERDPAGVDVVLERVHLGLDGVFAVTVRVPGRRAPVAVPRDEFGAVLVVEHVDAFPTVVLACTAFSQYAIIPSMERDRIAAGGEIDTTDVTNPTTIHFNRLHNRSEHVEEAVLLLGITTVVLVAWAESARTQA